MQEAKQVAVHAAASDLPVLIIGETGTAKKSSLMPFISSAAVENGH